MLYKLVHITHFTINNFKILLRHLYPKVVIFTVLLLAAPWPPDFSSLSYAE